MTTYSEVGRGPVSFFASWIANDLSNCGLLLLETESSYVAQAILELLGLNELPASAS
jgi:hypothetical protein